MKIVRTSVAFLILILNYIPVANANFGLGPCCSGVTCGIIPCDASCGGRAIITMGTTFSSNIMSVNASSNKLTTNAQETNNALVNYYSDLGSNLRTRISSILSGLDALSIRYESTKSQEIESWQALGNNLATQFNYAIKGYIKSETVLTHSGAFSEASQSSLLDAITNHSMIYTQVIADSRNDRNDLIQLHISTRKTIKDSKRDNVESQILPRLIETYVNPYSINGDIDTSAKTKAMASNALTSSAELNTPILAVSQMLSERITNGNNVSTDSIILNSVLSPMIDPKMLGETVTLNTTGLKRHIVTQQQIELLLQSKLGQQRKMRNRYLVELVHGANQ